MIVTNGFNMNWKEFEELARKVMTRYFGIELVEKNPKGFPKRFDMVSTDENTIGDAKYLTLVHRRKFPPAKMMEIAGHVWLLEKVNAKTRFLVFGNQRSVPEKWLEKYGKYARNIDFYFIDAHENVEKMGKTEAGEM
jgi:hypothetical protein